MAFEFPEPGRFCRFMKSVGDLQRLRGCLSARLNILGIVEPTDQQGAARI
jgi:hypothetical protein